MSVAPPQDIRLRRGPGGVEVFSAPAVSSDVERLRVEVAALRQQVASMETELSELRSQMASIMAHRTVYGGSR